MPRQDHAMEPLLRRLVRLVPEPRATAEERLELIDVELSGPMPDLGDVGAATIRVLVLAHGQPLGFVEVSGAPSEITPVELRTTIETELAEEIAEHLRLDGLASFDSLDGRSTPRCRLDMVADGPLVTVVIPTRNRTRQLARCLDSLRDLRYPNFEVIVVDNAPSDDTTMDLVSSIGRADPRIRYVREPRPGASRARNVGMREGRGEVVAFTDDDVRVDPLWLDGLVAGFRDASVEMVGGLTVPSSLDTPAQHAFELYGGMGRGHRRRVYDLRQNRGDTLLYPYTPGIFGASNNAAFRRESFLRRGGLDMALGPATPAYSAEDLDAFLAVILDGKTIVYEPRAIVRHEHRREFADLYWQVFTYSAGSSALLTKWALTRWSVATELARRLPGLLPAALLHRHRSGAEAGVGAYPGQLRWLERVGYLYGPIAYARSLLWARRQRRS
jgi:glycosyltransferase involved in cell wall biosynthesis